MSRSRRRTPVMGIAGDSDRADKRRANRALRRAVRANVTAEPPTLREVSDVRGFAKDGKRRFDPMVRPKEMRK